MSEWLRTNEKVMVFLIYFFLILGGIYNKFNVLQSVMNGLAPYFIAMIAVISLTVFLNTQPDKGRQYRALLWLAFVFITSIAIEEVGVVSGKLFGEYWYPDTLGHKIGHVPLAIGFAWISSLLGAFALIQRLNIAWIKNNIWVQTLLIAIAMVLFDFFMEPAAVELNYWQWKEAMPPARNYFTWGAMGFGYMWMGIYMKVIPQKTVPVLPHLYIAQIVYFLLSVL